jgi:zinc finger SWIM domain-containing protein 3
LTALHSIPVNVNVERALKKFQQDNYVQLYRRSSRKLGTGSKYKKNMEVAESAAGLLIYKELDYSCIHGGKKFSSIPSGQRPNTR